MKDTIAHPLADVEADYVTSMPTIRPPVYKQIEEYLSSLGVSTGDEPPEDTTDETQAYYEYFCDRIGARLNLDVDPLGHWSDYTDGPSGSLVANARYYAAISAEHIQPQLVAGRKQRRRDRHRRKREQRTGELYDTMCDLIDETDADDGHLRRSDEGAEIVLEFHDEPLAEAGSGIDSVRSPDTLAPKSEWESVDDSLLDAVPHIDSPPLQIDWSDSP